MPRGKRYFSEFADEKGTTPSQLKRLSKSRQREYLLHWFNMYYEDPAQETPYNSEEGGYLYVWGGPYDAREELAEEFGSLVSESVIESVVDEVESDGLTDWAPGRHHSDHQRAAQEYYEENQDDEKSHVDMLEDTIERLEQGAVPTFGDALDQERRRIISEDIDKILQSLPAQTHAGIGHNNPPLDEESTEQDVIAEIREAATVIKTEIAKEAPNALETARATSRLRQAASWIGKKIDTAADAFSKKVGELSAMALVGGGVIGLTTGWSSLEANISNVVSNTSHWLAHIIIPF